MNDKLLRKKILDIITHKPPGIEYPTLDLSLYESDVDELMALFHSEQQALLQKVKDVVLEALEK